MILAQEAVSDSSRVVTLVLFGLMIAATLGITVWASRNTRSATHFHSGGRRFSPLQNGLAIGSDYMSAASFLGIAGMMALFGYDGFLYSIGFLEPGLRYGVEVAGDPLQTMWNKLDLISLGLALVLGTAGLPHILIRFYTVPNSQSARKSVNWGIGLIGTFYLMTLVLGFGAAALVGHEAITAQDAAGNTAAPQLASVVGERIGGEMAGAVLLALIASAAFAAILSTVAGLVIASSSSLAHDFYNSVIRKGRATGSEEVKFARTAAIGVGAVAIALAIFAQNLNVAFLVALAFAIAASANLPTLLLSLFWKRFNTAGALAGIYGGLISAVGLVFFSPVVSGSESALMPNVDFAWFPLPNPALVSVPISLLCAVVGTYMSKERDFDKFAMLQVRALTGAGAEKAADH